jgi:hypothetical protein
MKELAILFGLGFVLSTAVATGARAQDRVCNDVDSPITSGTTINGNVNVPGGATCTLTDVTVNGNVTVGNGSTLTATADAAGFLIKGNVQAQNSLSLDLEGETVSGNVQSNGPADVNIVGMTISHNLQLQNADSFCLQQTTSVGGDIQIQGTTNIPPGGSVCGGTATANLICGTTVGGDTSLQQNLGTIAIGTNGSSYCNGKEAAPAGAAPAAPAAPAAAAAPAADGAAPPSEPPKGAKPTSTVTVGGNLQIQQNGTVYVDFTSVGHNLQCNQNTTVSNLNGSDDTIQGSNQCPGVM